MLKSAVTDPGVYDNLTNLPQTAWRIDRMKNMTYTQFWQLVKERRVDKVPCLACICLSNMLLLASGLPFLRQVSLHMQRHDCC